MLWVLEVELPYEFVVDEPEEILYIQTTLRMISHDLMVEYIGCINEEHVGVVYIEEDIEEDE